MLRRWEKLGCNDAATERLRVHSEVAFRRSEHLERIVGRNRSSSTEETVLVARAISQRLQDETGMRALSWSSPTRFSTRSRPCSRKGDVGVDLLVPSPG